MNKNLKLKLFLVSLFVLLLLGGDIASLVSLFWGQKVFADTSVNEESLTDHELYEKYKLYLGYWKRKKYSEYKEAKDKYGFSNSAEKNLYKNYYKNYKLYKKNPSRYPQYAGYYEQYKKYKNYKNKYQPLKKYAKYAKYNRSKYNKSSYGKYGKSKYKRGYDRYLRSLKNEANLGGSALGPEISVGILSLDKSNSKNNPFTFRANKDYRVKNSSGTILANITANNEVKVRYSGDGKLEVSGSSLTTVLADEIVYLEPQDGNSDDAIFNVDPNPYGSFDDYRGKVRVKYVEQTDKVWVINALPLEHYVWGMGEITGTGDADYNRVMTTSYRTYGYWKIKFSTKYANEGFKVDATSSSQIYYGYDWEKDHDRIKEAAIDTRGKIVMYNDRIAITPYSSWTDGRTRSFEERWGSKGYPWCQSVSDPYGKHPSKTTAELMAEGNHMVGLSAHGALVLASDHGWDWQRILNYYFKGINLYQAY